MGTGHIILFPGGFATDSSGSGNNAGTPQFTVSSGTQTSNTPKAGFLSIALDSATDEHWLFQFPLPSDYASGGTLRGKLRCGATSGNVIMKAGAVPILDNTTDIDVAVFNAADVSSAIAADAVIGKPSPFTIALTTTGFTANALVLAFCGRDADNGSDTMNSNDAEILSLVFEYTTT